MEPDSPTGVPDVPEMTAEPAGTPAAPAPVEMQTTVVAAQPEVDAPCDAAPASGLSVRVAQMTRRPAGVRWLPAAYMLAERPPL